MIGLFGYYSFRIEYFMEALFTLETQHSKKLPRIMYPERPLRRNNKAKSTEK